MVRRRTAGAIVLGGTLRDDTASSWTTSNILSVVQEVLLLTEWYVKPHGTPLGAEKYITHPLRVRFGVGYTLWANCRVKKEKARLCIGRFRSEITVANEGGTATNNVTF